MEKSGSQPSGHISASENRREGQQPLTGYRVLDLSGPMGVFCGKLMADMGADVIKVEPPGGDPMRRIGPFVHDQPHPERSLYWLHFNTNKRSITLDIASPEGTDLFCRLAQKADIVLESFQPGFLKSLGLGYDELGALNRGLVYVSITAFGQTGPYKDYKASDLTGFAMGGYMYATGWSHTPPTRLWGSQAYHTASNRAFIASLISIYDRLWTGLGQHIDVSMHEAVASTTEHVPAAYLYEGTSAVRCGFLHGGVSVFTWKCKDGYVSISPNNERSWDELRGWMAEDGMVGDLLDEKYNDRIVRRGDLGPHIDELISKWALLHTRQEIEDRGQSRASPFGSGLTPIEFMENAHLRDRGFFVEAGHPEFDATFTYPGAPYKFSRSPWKLRITAPSIGQHNMEVYQDELAVSGEELELLAGAGII